MFNFMRRPGMQNLSPAVLQALQADGLPTGTDLAKLGMVESAGTYAGRKVTFIRVFDPTDVVQRSVDVYTGHTYDDLNANLDLVLRAGHVERDGTVVLSQARQVSRKASRGPEAEPDGPRSPRASANRAEHADDDRFVSTAGAR